MSLPGPMKQGGSRIAMVIVVALALVALAVFGWIWLRGGMSRVSPTNEQIARPSADPRLTYVGPFQNVHPDVQYVGDAACAECHPRETEQFHQHPMHLTMRKGDQLSSLPTGAIPATFAALGREFSVEQRNGAMWQTHWLKDSTGQPQFKQEFEVKYVIGSGQRGHSFLTARDGFVFQTPMTWYSQKQLWDLAPGFTSDLLGGRPIVGECLFCHSNGAPTSPDSEHLYQQPLFPYGLGIGCERCHGPGGKHVLNPGLRATKSGRLDPTIVNPRHLTPAVRDDICWQCHLEGIRRVVKRGRAADDFRPGLPLKAFVTVFHDAGQQVLDAAVNHVGQMVQSKCYQASAGPNQLGCVTCHDPHERLDVEQRAQHYRQACFQCHQDDSCSLTIERRHALDPQDRCDTCHMPTYSAQDIPHTASTDHRIWRIPPRTAAGPAAVKHVSRQNFRSFFGEPASGNDPELERDRAVALAETADPTIAADALAAAAAQDPEDWKVQFLHGSSLLARYRTEDAERVFREILKRRPHYELGRSGLAAACAAAGKLEEAENILRGLVQEYPHAPSYRLRLVQLAVRQQRWGQAARDATEWVQADPGNREAREQLRNALVQLGRTSGAAEQERVLNDLKRN
jgi:thioredoxin-like negative regulator of GroEL